MAANALLNRRGARHRKRSVTSNPRRLSSRGEGSAHAGFWRRSPRRWPRRAASMGHRPPAADRHHGVRGDGL